MVTYATATEIGMKVGVKGSTIKRWAKMGLIPSLKLTGRILRFDPQAVEQALAKRAAEHQTQREGVSA